MALDTHVAQHIVGMIVCFIPLTYPKVKRRCGSSFFHCRDAREPPGTARPHVMEKKLAACHRYLLLMSDGVYKSLEAASGETSGLDSNKLLLNTLNRELASALSFSLVAERVLQSIAHSHHTAFQRSAAVDRASAMAVACRKRDDMTLVIYRFPQT